MSQQYEDLKGDDLQKYKTVRNYFQSNPIHRQLLDQHFIQGDDAQSGPGTMPHLIGELNNLIGEQQRRGGLSHSKVIKRQTQSVEGITELEDRSEKKSRKAEDGNAGTTLQEAEMDCDEGL